MLYIQHYKVNALYQSVELFGKDCEIAESYRGMIDFMPKGCDKGLAVKALSEIWGISPDDCVAIGDELNDAPMIKAAGLGVAMKNGREELKLIYNPNIKMAESQQQLKEKFYEIIKSSFDNDMRQRTTTKGPHKDDMEFLINEINVRNFGSQGQQRTSALSLKLAELNLIKEETGEDAILLLDDVMSELDLQRQEFLIKSLSNIQMFITTTEISDKLKETLPEGKIFYVTSGTVEGGE